MRRRLSLLRRRLRGVGLLEILLGLAIAAILLAALGTALYAASASISGNQSSFTTAQTARLAVARISKALRTAHAVQIGAASDSADGSTATGTALYIAPTPTTLVAYIYDAAGQRLLYDADPASPSDAPSLSEMAARMPENSSTPSVFVLARDVRALGFSCTYANHTANSVNVRLVTGNPHNNSTFTCDQAIVPRKTVPPATSPAPAS